MSHGVNARRSVCEIHKLAYEAITAARDETNVTIYSIHNC